MNNLLLNKYNLLITNQIRLKIKKKRIFPKNSLKKLKATIFLLKIDSFKNILVIESLFLLRLIFNKKSYVSYLKKKYKEYDLIINIDLHKKKTYYFILLWIIFIFPIIKKRNIKLKNKYNSMESFVFSQNIYIIYPFFPNIYFSWSKPISYLLNYFLKDKQNTKIYSAYYRFLL